MPSRTVHIAAGGLVAAALLAACSSRDGTTIGPPAAATPVDTPVPTTTPAATTPAATGTPDRTPATTYRTASFDVPLATAGWATVHTLVPSRWTPKITTGGGPLYASASATFDRRDPSGALLVRLRYEPTDTPGTEEGAMAGAIAEYRALPGATVTVTRPTYRGEGGLTQADWTVRLRVGGKPRLVLMRAWLLDNQVITAYVSVPAGSTGTAEDLFAHAAQLTYEIHSGPSPTPAAG
jgi:hypothetical protein